jgi:putative membrane protein
LTRQIWVNVALPPTGETPGFVKGKTPIADISVAHLRKRKIDALRLCLSFAFAVKHYLRGEDGTQWDDYTDVLPASFARFDEVGCNTQKTSGSYAATRSSSVSASQDGSQSGRASPDATKRIRVKRSKPKLSASQDTPLLLSNTVTHRSVEFHPFADQASLPLPLMFALYQLSIFLVVALTI